MHKTIVGIALVLVSLLSSCASHKNTSAQAMQLEFKDSSYKFIIPGEANALIVQEFRLEPALEATELNLDSLVLVDGKVNLQQQGQSPIWIGSMQWNWKEEGQLQAGDSATVYGHRGEIVLIQKVALSRSEDIYLPAEAPY